MDARKLDKVAAIAMQFLGREHLLRQLLRAKYSADLFSDDDELLACNATLK